MNIRLLPVTAILLCAMGCTSPKGRRTPPAQAFTTICRLPATPVKDQGHSSLCWAYAMLATIETEHITRGDSVNLSPAYVARAFLEEQAEAMYLARGRGAITTRGTMPMLVRLIMEHGLVPYDTYRSEANMQVVARRTTQQVQQGVKRREGLDRLHRHLTDMLDQTVSPLPRRVYMYRAEYTPQQFATSVCREGEWRALTSFTHQPYHRHVSLQMPDNYYGDLFYNTTLGSLTAIVEQSLLKGHPVCWEGDISEEGFRWQEGVATLPQYDGDTDTRPAPDTMLGITADERQHEFERYLTTDDHCMAIIGIAKDRHGRRFFICKNSWGTANAHHGYIYMSYNYFRLKTIAVMVNNG